MKRILKPLINTLTLFATLFINYFVNTGGTDKTVGEVSRQYDSLFTPAGYAFSIWGFIYLQLLVYIGFQWYTYIKQKERNYWSKSGYWFAMSNIANAFWILAWVNELPGLSVMIMLLLLFSLIQLVLRLDLEMWDAPIRVIASIWWPITFYLGWIVLATVANISAYLVSIGYDGTPLSPITWTIVMILIATIIYVVLTFSRNMREASLVGIWGLVAIAYRHWGHCTVIALTALLAAILLLVTSAIHGYKNRTTSPLKKWTRGEV